METTIHRIEAISISKKHVALDNGEISKYTNVIIISTGSNRQPIEDKLTLWGDFDIVSKEKASDIYHDLLKQFRNKE